MTAKSGADPLHSWDDLSGGDQGAFYFNFSQSQGPDPAGPGPVLVPDETIEANSANNGPGGPGSVIAMTGGGITINLEFDAAAMAAPASFRAGIQQAAAILAATIADPITVNIAIDYSGVGGGAAGGPEGGLYVNYSTVRADLVSHATAGDKTFNVLPSGTTFDGQPYVAVWDAQLKLWGLAMPSDYTGIDGSATFATDINPNLLVGVALHELTHAIGRVPYGVSSNPTYSSPYPDIFDFFRYTSPGQPLLDGDSSAPAAYFSLDGGNTRLAAYGQTSDASDFLNGGVQGSNDPFNEFYSNNTLQSLTGVDLKQLDALGYQINSSLNTTIEAAGATSLVKLANNYFLTTITTGLGPELKLSGTPVAAGQFGSIAPIGVEAITGGYEVAWKDTSNGQYTVWATDSNGNFTNILYGPGSGNSPALEQLETSFQQDLNGDGTIGVSMTVIEAFGSTKLAQLGSNYFLNPAAGGTGPELKLSGTPVTVGQFGSIAPIGVEAITGGYEVAWKDTSTGQYTVWATDSNGNFTNILFGPGSGNSPALEQLEPSFQQD
ncbi:MAG: NF038122 family metalloprotease, partial [Bradyrhizobium sp.]|uniref:NF038122 family metalloprotease n=1 Tax=Bradyrhizobium sp. TaxID=376 RepID=UPI001DC69D3C